MKSLFESPFFGKITRVADFFLVSLLFLLTSLPVITVFLSMTAAYYTMAKMLRYDAGTSVAGCYFKAFKENWKQGLLFGVLSVLAGIILYTFVDVANAVGWHTFYSKFYLVLTVVYGTVVLGVLLNLAAIVSRFRVSALGAVKLAWQFLKQKPLRLLTYVITLIGVILISYILPPLTLVLPGGYFFSFTYYAEPLLQEYMEEHISPDEIPGWMREDPETEEG